MKKTLKTIFIGFTILTLLLVFAGCNTETNPGNPNDNTDVTTTGDNNTGTTTGTTGGTTTNGTNGDDENDDYGRPGYNTPGYNAPGINDNVNELNDNDGEIIDMDDNDNGFNNTDTTTRDDRDNALGALNDERLPFYGDNGGSIYQAQYDLNGADNGGLPNGSAPNILGGPSYPSVENRNNTTDRYGNIVDNGYGNQLENTPGQYGNVPSNWHIRYPYNNPTGNYYRGNTVLNTVDKNNEYCEIADSIKSNVKGLREVRDAEVAVTDNTIYVGYKPGFRANNTKNLNALISDRVRKMYPNAKNISISTKNSHMQTIRRAYAKMKNSNSALNNIDSMLQSMKNMDVNYNQDYKY